MKLGDTFKSEHLWIVCSLPAADSSVVAVGFTTWRPRCDDENCVIEPGEHPFVKHKTVIAYEKARLLSIAQQQQVEKLCPAGPPASAALLDKIQLGALKSDLMVAKYQEIIRASRALQAKVK